jgi:hypothetical protein
VGVSADGVIPVHGPLLTPVCDAQHPLAGAPCELDEGHDGMHEAVLLWEDGP